MRPHDKSHIIIKLWNVLDEVKGIFAEDDVKNIVTKLRQFRGINVVSWKKYYKIQMYELKDVQYHLKYWNNHLLSFSMS